MLLLLGALVACGGADLSVSPVSLDFGEVDFQQTRPDAGFDPLPVTITNNGKDPVDLVIENFDSTHLLLGAQLVVDDPPTLASLEEGQQAVLTVAVWDYDVAAGERDSLVKGSFDLNASNLKDPLVVSWSFTPIRNIGGDTGT